MGAPEVRALAAVPSEAHPQVAASTADDLGPYAPRSRRRTTTIVFVVAALVARHRWRRVVAALMRR